MTYLPPICRMGLLVALTLGTTANAENWPQYLGLNRDGISPETGLARSWPEGGPKSLWNVPVGEGYGGPAIFNGEVYILDRVNIKTPDEAADVLRVIALDTGEELWRVSHDAPGETSHNGSRTPPTVTESHVYAVGLTGWLYCIDRKSREIAWSRNLKEEFPPAFKLMWGYAQSPTVDGDSLILAPQSNDAFLASFDKNNGELKWKTEPFGAPGYASPRVTTLAGTKQVVILSVGRHGGAAGYDFNTGKELWTYNGWNCRIPIAPVTVLPDNRVFITGEYGSGSAMIRVTQSDGAFNVEELYKVKDAESQIHPPIPFEDHLYLNSNGNKRNDGMICMTEGGEILWKTRDNRDLPRFERGSLILADGLIYNLDGRRGTLHLIEPSPEGYKELAQAAVLDGSKIWAPMALSDGKLVLRSQSEMKCLDLRGN